MQETSVPQQATLAEALTTASIEQVREHADADWLHEARVVLVKVCATHTTFTTDDLWAKGLPMPREPRALGAIMREAAKAGVCVATDTYARSTRPECHTRPIRVWRSLLTTELRVVAGPESAPC